MHGSTPPKVSPVDSIARFTNPHLIRVNLRARDLPSIIHELSVALQEEARIPELLPFYHAALNREYLCCTALGNGLAFPHAAVIGLPKLSFAFGKTCTPIPWGSGTCSAVRMVFLSAVPAEDSITYISLVSGFARTLQEQRYCAATHDGQNPGRDPRPFRANQNFHPSFQNQDACLDRPGLFNSRPSRSIARPYVAASRQPQYPPASGLKLEETGLEGGAPSPPGEGEGAKVRASHLAAPAGQAAGAAPSTITYSPRPFLRRAPRSGTPKVRRSSDAPLRWQAPNV